MRASLQRKAERDHFAIEPLPDVQQRFTPSRFGVGEVLLLGQVMGDRHNHKRRLRLRDWAAQDSNL